MNSIINGNEQITNGTLDFNSNMIPVLNIPVMTDEKWNELAAIYNNMNQLAELMSETGATYNEAYIMAELDCSLEEAQLRIEYEREKAAIMPELIRFFNANADSAEELAEEMAWRLVFGK